MHLFVVLSACVVDRGEGVYIENKTDETLAVFDDGTQRNVVAPGDTASYVILEFEGTMTFTVKTLVGRELASRTFTWDEIREEDGIRIIAGE